jgi:hypothetical protein
VYRRRCLNEQPSEPNCRMGPNRLAEFTGESLPAPLIITGFIQGPLRVMQSLSPREGCTTSGQGRLKPERPPRLKRGQDVPL